MPGAGRCINCSDKPKFGGAGIRKQSCIFRRCERPQSDWDEKPELQSPKAQPLSAVPDPSAAQLPPATTTVTEEESLFWGAVQVLQGSGPRQQQCAPCAPSPCGLQSKLKGNRCGECAACNRDDCGSCLNCRDKPRFGGRGARKQACVMRTCATPWMGSGASEPDEAEELSDSTSSDETASPSADSPLGLQPSQPAACPTSPRSPPRQSRSPLTAPRIAARARRFARPERPPRRPWRQRARERRRRRRRGSRRCERSTCSGSSTPACASATLRSSRRARRGGSVCAARKRSAPATFAPIEGAASPRARAPARRSASGSANTREMCWLAS